MSRYKLGPHDQEGGEAGKRWARRANVVKAVGNPAVLHEAPAHALRLWRWPFDPREQDRLMAASDARGFADQLLRPLNGYTHPRLWVEGPNEIGRPRFAELCAFLGALKEELAARGHRLTGPCSATGDYEAADVERLRPLGLSLWTFHGYMTRQVGPTHWNAYRARLFWRAGDPPVVYSECGFDRCRDGESSTNGGYLPLGDGPYGWERQFADSPDPVGEASRQLERYAVGLTEPWEWGATVFTTSPNDEWRRKGFDADPLVDRLAAPYEPWTPEVPTVAQIKGIDVSNHQGTINWAAVQRDGYVFAAMKASGDESASNVYLDPTFPANWRETGALGFVRIAYHYARPSRVSPARSITTLQQAVDAVGGLRTFDNVALDTEDPDVPDGTSLHVHTAESLALAERVFGPTPWKYSARYYTRTHDLEHADLARYPTWWASSPPKPAPVTGWGPIRIWQHDWFATVPGVQGVVDVNVFDGTLEELRALGKPAPPAVSWEAPVLGPIYRGASAVGGMPDRVPDDEADARRIIDLMAKLKARHPA